MDVRWPNDFVRPAVGPSTDPHCILRATQARVMPAPGPEAPRPRTNALEVPVTSVPVSPELVEEELRACTAHVYSVPVVSPVTSDVMFEAAAGTTPADGRIAGDGGMLGEATRAGSAAPWSRVCAARDDPQSAADSRLAGLTAVDLASLGAHATT